MIVSAKSLRVIAPDHQPLELDMPPNIKDEAVHAKFLKKTGLNLILSRKKEHKLKLIFSILNFSKNFFSHFFYSLRKVKFFQRVLKTIDYSTKIKPTMCYV